MNASSGTIFLHIGAGKTGTTAIQATIPVVRRDLKAAGLCAPLDPTESPDQEFRPRVASGFSFTLAKLLNPGFRRGLPFDAPTYWDWLRLELQSARNDNLNLLFSSEALQFARSKQLQRFRDFAEKHCFQVRILFYARTALDYSISEYLQHLKTGFSDYPRHKTIPSSLRAYIASTIAPFGATLSTYSSIFGDESIEVRNYDVVKDHLIDDFFSTVSGRAYDCIKPTRHNRSLTRSEQEALEHLLMQDNGSELCRRIGNKLITTPFSKSDKRTYYVDNDSISKFKLNNEPVVSIVNKFLPLDRQVSVATGSSPVTTSYQDDFNPDWHDTYARIIRTLVST